MQNISKPQWITLGVAILLTVGLYAATQSQFFGTTAARTPAVTGAAPEAHNDGLRTDSVLWYAKQPLSPAQNTKLATLEYSVVRGDVGEQRLHSTHQLARYWRDSASASSPLAMHVYAWYTGEAARLENSANSLSFAARLFLEALTAEQVHPLKHWEADQAKDLFERSLKINPDNDSAKVGLGATILYGGLGAPMTGIGMVRGVAEKNPENVYAQLTLGEASLMSGQLDKAVERFETVVRLQPANLQAGLLLADSYEKLHKKAEAAQAYQRTLPHIDNPALKAEVQKRITQLKTR